MSAKGQPQVVVRWKKKKGHGGGHHGGAWKVAYADFITCMFALFLVLWLLTQADLKLRQELARYFRNAGVQSGGSMLGDKLENAKTENKRPLEAALTIVQGVGEELEALRGSAKEIQEALEHEPEFGAIKDHVRVEVTSEGLEIQIVDSGASGRKGLLFDLSSSALKPELVALLKELAGHLKTLPNHIEIGGHTDARPFAAGAGLSNWDLSFERANNARAVLEQSGIRSSQILRISAYGAEKPLNVADPLADENRRLSILARREKTDKDEQAGPASAGFGGQPVAPRIVDPGTPPV
ncbi:MAG: OmpA family protein [Deltaproteobacteria bacterium]|nr:OmpA family protein [Deltaproteobacteria bacterium]